MATVHIEEVYDKLSFINEYTDLNNQTIAGAFSVMEHVPCDVLFESDKNAEEFCCRVMGDNVALANVTITFSM